MDLLRSIWPNRADIAQSMIRPTERDLWEQRAIGVFFAVGSVALYGTLGYRLVKFLLGLR